MIARSGDITAGIGPRQNLVPSVLKMTFFAGYPMVEFGDGLDQVLPVSSRGRDQDQFGNIVVFFILSLRRHDQKETHHQGQSNQLDCVYHGISLVLKKLNVQTQYRILSSDGAFSIATS